MKTGCLWTATGPGRIAICRSVPKHLASLPRYAPLAPPAWMHGREINAFRRAYFGAVLSKLDPQRVVDELHALVPGHEPILLCWERLVEPGDWCHRTMVASYFKHELGLVVDELPIVGKRASPQLDLFAA